MKKSTFFAIGLLLTITLIAQSKNKSVCYRETLGQNAKIFTKSLSYPRYRDGDKELSIFIADNIHLSSMIKFLPDTVHFFEDSIKVKFVISWKGEMSDLFVKSEWDVLNSEIKTALIKSSCNWIPGGTEMYLTVWYNGVIYVRLEKMKNSFLLTIKSNSENI